MAKPGPKPQPNQIKKLRGAESRYINDKEPKFKQVAKRRAPRGFFKDDGKRFWRTFVPLLAEVGVLTEADIPAFTVLCLQYQIAMEVGKQLQEEGVLTKDERGMVRKHPLLQVWRDSAKTFLQYATEFGMTPSSRTRLGVEIGERQMTLAEILFSDLPEEK